MQDISSISIQNVLNIYLKKHQSVVFRAKVLNAWPEIIGEKLAKLSQAYRLNIFDPNKNIGKANSSKSIQESLNYSAEKVENMVEYILIVLVFDNSWIQELSMHQVIIKEKYKQMFPTLRLRKIRFVYGNHKVEEVEKRIDKDEKKVLPDKIIEEVKNVELNISFAKTSFDKKWEKLLSKLVISAKRGKIIRNFFLQEEEALALKLEKRLQEKSISEENLSYKRHYGQIK